MNAPNASSTGTDGMWLIVKRGLYFRPDCQGYTGIKDEAGRYKYDLAKDYDRGECKIMREEDGPDFLPAAYNDLVIEHLTKQRDEARAELARVRGAAQAALDAATVEKCYQVVLEERCQRGTPWDLACTTIARKLLGLIGEAHRAPVDVPQSVDPAYPAWQPIETAPKDGSKIIYHNGQKMDAVIGYCQWTVFHDDGFEDWWDYERDCEASVRFWMPEIPLPTSSLSSTQNSPPDRASPLPSGEVDPSVMPDCAGGETISSTQERTP